MRNSPSVAAAPNGDFIVTWRQDDFQDIDSAGIFGKRFNSAAALQGAQFQISVYTDASQFDPEVAIAGDGSFVVAWRDFRNGDADLYARKFDSWVGTGDPGQCLSHRHPGIPFDRRRWRGRVRRRLA